jgi:hypothetical protein
MPSGNLLEENEENNETSHQRQLESLRDSKRTTPDYKSQAPLLHSDWFGHFVFNVFRRTNTSMMTAYPQTGNAQLVSK